MDALGLVNILNLLLCFHAITAYHQNHARIVTPVEQNAGGTVPNQISPNSPPPVTQATPTEAVTIFPNLGTFLGITFPTNINIFVNITSNNGFGTITGTPVELTTESTTVSIALPETQTEENPPSTTVSDVTVPLPETNTDLSNGQNASDFGVIDTGGGDNVVERPSQIIENKMTFEEKCEEYYSMGGRKSRKAMVQVFIVGGTNSLPKEFPHMAALGYGTESKKEWLCGGSLISENYVVTAAHCLSSKTLGNVQFVRLGSTNLQTETLDSVDYKVIKRIPHPAYNNDRQYNDIALLQLDRPVKFTDNIAPICLYSSKNLNQKKLIATGWGKTESAGDVSAELQKVKLEYFSNTECQLTYAIISKQELPLGIVDETQICAGSKTEEKDTCQGDSGGPLQFQENGRMYLVGITSFGIGCGKPGNPGVYTRVSYFIPWIQKIVWGK